MAEKKKWNKGRRVGYIRKDVSYCKPPNLQHLLTAGEVSTIVEKTPDAIRKAENLGKISLPQRYFVNGQWTRLYTPEQLEEIKLYFKQSKQGTKWKGKIISRTKIEREKQDHKPISYVEEILERDSQTSGD